MHPRGDIVRGDIVRGDISTDNPASENPATRGFSDRTLPNFSHAHNSSVKDVCLAAKKRYQSQSG